jgi:hypothetical protein
MKLEAACFFETPITIYKSTRRYNPEDQHRHLYRRDNLRSHLGYVVLPYTLIDKNQKFFFLSPDFVPRPAIYSYILFLLCDQCPCFFVEETSVVYEVTA